MHLHLCKKIKDAVLLFTSKLVVAPAEGGANVHSMLL